MPKQIVEFTANPIESGYLPIPLNDVTVQIAEGIASLRNAEVPSEGFHCNELTSYTQSGNSVSLSIPETLEVQDVAGLRDFIRPSQVQLLMFILFAWRRERRNEFPLNINEYFAVRGIRRRKENVDRFYEDLAILSSISVDIGAIYKKQSYHVYGNLLSVGTKPSITIKMGTWIEDLSLTTFTLLHKKFFQNHGKQNWYITMLSIKLAQLIKVNAKKKGKSNRLRNATILQFLDISEQQIKKQGFGYYVKLLDSAFHVLCEQEGYNIAFEGHINNYQEFINATVAYQNSALRLHYKSNLK